MAYVWVNGWVHSSNYDNVTFKFSFNVSSSSVWNNDGQVVSVWGWVSGDWTYYGQLSNYAREWTQTAYPGCPSKGNRASANAHIQTYDKGGGSWPNWGNKIENITGYTYWNPRFDASMLSLSTSTTTSRSVNYSGLDTPQSERLNYQLPNGTFAQTANGSKAGTINFTGMSPNTKYTRTIGMTPSNSTSGYICSGAINYDVYPAMSTLSLPTVTNTPVSATSARTAWTAGFANRGNATYTNTLALRVHGTGTNTQLYTDDLTIAGNRTFTGMAVNTRYNVRSELAYKYHDGVTTYPGVTSIIYPTYSTVIAPKINVNRDSTDPSRMVANWSTTATNLGNLVGWSAEIVLRREDDEQIISRTPCNATVAGSVSVTNLPYDCKIKVCMELSGLYFDNTFKSVKSDEIILDYVCNVFVKVNDEWRRGIRIFVKVNGVWRPNAGLVRVKQNGEWK